METALTANDRKEIHPSYARDDNHLRQSGIMQE